MIIIDMKNLKIYCVTNKILNFLDDSNYNIGWVGNEKPPKNYMIFKQNPMKIIDFHSKILSELSTSG